MYDIWNDRWIIVKRPITIRVFLSNNIYTYIKCYWCIVAGFQESFIAVQKPDRLILKVPVVQTIINSNNCLPITAPSVLVTLPVTPAIRTPILYIYDFFEIQPTWCFFLYFLDGLFLKCVYVKPTFFSLHC